MQSSGCGYSSAQTAYDSAASQHLYDRVVAAFQALADLHHIPKSKRFIVSGQPGRAICGFVAKHQIDVVIVSRTDRPGHDKWMGGTAEYVLYNVHESILSL